MSRGLRVSRKKIHGFRKAMKLEDSIESSKYISIKKMEKTKRRQNNTAVLFRFLEARVGQTWNSVYSELCYEFRQPKYYFLKEQVFWLVVKDVVIFDKANKPCWKGGYYHGKPIATVNPHRLFYRFFIHPETGILMKI
jgi:hypothetical protein